MKRELTIWENVFANDTSDKVLISTIYKKTHMTQYQEDKQSSLKMGKGPQ